MTRPDGLWAASTRERALRDAAADVCTWCGGRSLVNGQPSRDVLQGPPGSGNLIHETGHGQTALCVASSIWNRIAWEARRVAEIRGQLARLAPRPGVIQESP